MNFSFDNKLFKTLSQREFLLNKHPDLWADRIFLKEDREVIAKLKEQPNHNQTPEQDL